MKNLLLGLIIVLLLMLVGGVSYLFDRKIIQVNIPTRSDTPTIITSSTPVLDETENLKKIIRQALVAKHGTTANELTITVSKIQVNFAQGGASASGGGGMWFAAKVNDSWKLVWDGNGVILCTDIEPYPQFPTDMIPECYNEKTGKSIKR